jgi:GTP cyclohydrolase I
MIDQDKIKRAVHDILIAIGEDPSREGIQETPRRIAEMYAEVFSGMKEDPREVLSVGFEEGHNEMVILKDIPFYSMCEHHLLPFYGMAHIGYIPKGRVVGASKLGRVVEILAKRPQLQERLTTQIADTIVEALQPQGVAVVDEGREETWFEYCDIRYARKLPNEGGYTHRVPVTDKVTSVLQLKIFDHSTTSDAYAAVSP